MKFKELKEKLDGLDQKFYENNKKATGSLKTLMKEVGYLNLNFDELSGDEKWELKQIFMKFADVLSWLYIFPFYRYLQSFGLLTTLEKELLRDLEESFEGEELIERSGVLELGEKFIFETRQLLWNLILEYLNKEGEED